VPASASSPIAVLSAHTGLKDVEPDVEQDADLLVALAAVPDPRKARGYRHQLVTVLAIGVCAVLAGARSYVAIADRAQDLPCGCPKLRAQPVICSFVRGRWPGMIRW
jgi:hypothetical protein